MRRGFLISGVPRNVTLINPRILWHRKKKYTSGESVFSNNAINLYGITIRDYSYGDAKIATIQSEKPSSLFSFVTGRESDRHLNIIFKRTCRSKRFSNKCLILFRFTIASRSSIGKLLC